MRNQWKTVSALAVISAGLVLAQGPPARRPPAKAEGGPQARQVEFLATYLGLSDSQKDQAKTVFNNAAQAARALRDPLRQAREALRKASEGNRSDGEIDQLAATVGNLTGQIEAIDAKAQARFHALLTPEQTDKLNKMPGLGLRVGGRGGF